MESINMDDKLWNNLYLIVLDWVFEHPDLTIDELVDDLHDYVLDNYGPPF